jgi:hypothetical protein
MAADWTSGWTVDRMAAAFTPQQAARIKHQAISLRLCCQPDAHIDEMMRNDAGHQWFLFCLDAVARRA